MFSKEKKSSDLFLRSNAAANGTAVPDFFEEMEIPGKPLAFAGLETLESFIFTRDCPSFSLIALELAPHATAWESFAGHLETMGNSDDILIVREEKRRFLILLKERDSAAAADFIRSVMRPFEKMPFFAGIFSHPIKEFSAGSSLWNAKKALKHSILTGTETIIVFDAVSLNISGDAAWQEGNLDEALREYRDALKLDPENANVLNSIGVLYAVQNKLDEALEFFRGSADADASEVMPVYNEGLVHELKEEREKALEAFEKAMSLAPEAFEIFFHAGKTYMDSGNTEKALPLLEKAHAFRPGHGPVLAFLAECFLVREDFEKAFHFFRKAQQRMPQDPQVLSGLGFCFFKKNDGLDIAATFCEEALALEPENALFALRLARIRMTQDQKDSALPLLLRAQDAGLELFQNEILLLNGI